jgi:PPOX class probable F420-dependent enzyme
MVSALAGDLAELPVWARDLLERARVARLGLLDDEDSPRVLPVTFAIQGGAIWSAIDRKSKRDPDREPARLRYLRRRPQVALTADQYSDDWRRLAWVQVIGEATIIPIDDEPGVAEALAQKYAPYGDQRPPGPLIRIEPGRMLCWRAQAGGSPARGASPIGDGD